ncbi:serine hydrolase domain-containing protein [Algoriphagus hitonicola]|uniref:CubicO group peptidase, beta-lactamase class C family n=1 Tax=Algoriphagus hitonicola TaxID=435880 RepID=A0A1I2VP01_9BACT|nr:serine hydrolase domain-containing protein [Algoriphagus hitonicola]SFG90803.1 CubicO group peptidase, beta-lactamase class C family [Algoriphagus hitonicola]
MKLSLKLVLLIFAFLSLIFIGIEWWQSHPKVNLPVPLGTFGFDDRMDSILITTLNQNQLAGLSVGLIIDSEIVYTGAAGFSNLETKDSLTSVTQIPTASVSKLFTALLVSSYFLENDIQPEDNISSHFPSIVKEFPQLEDITIASLLTHQSGLSDKGYLGSWLGIKKPLRLENHIKNILSKRVNQETDSIASYSDLNFELLAFLLEQNSQSSFEKLMNPFLQVELGMTQTYFKTPDQSDSLTTQGYQKTFLWKRLKNNPFVYEVLPDPASGMISSTHDLLKALIQLSRGDLGYLQPHLEWLEQENSGLAGFQQVKLGNQTYWGHFGGQDGFSSLLLFDLELGNGLVILSNTADKTDFRKQLAEKLEPFLYQKP